MSTHHSPYSCGFISALAWVHIVYFCALVVTSGSVSYNEYTSSTLGHGCYNIRMFHIMSTHPPLLDMVVTTSGWVHILNLGVLDVTSEALSEHKYTSSSLGFGCYIRSCFIPWVHILHIGIWLLHQRLHLNMSTHPPPWPWGSGCSNIRGTSKAASYHSTALLSMCTSVRSSGHDSWRVTITHMDAMVGSNSEPMAYNPSGTYH